LNGAVSVGDTSQRLTDKVAELMLANRYMIRLSSVMLYWKGPLHAKKS
jgi:hypothetical protein